MPASESLRLSAKGLGDALPDASPGCLWVSLRFDLPYQRFPGVFTTIDRFLKNTVHKALDDTGRLPPWFPDIGRVASYERDLSYKRFRVWHEELGIDLAGSPDDVFRMEDGSLHIVDYKTAKLTEGQKAYLPLYEVQLNAYAYLEERGSKEGCEDCLRLDTLLLGLAGPESRAGIDMRLRIEFALYRLEDSMRHGLARWGTRSPSGG